MAEADPMVQLETAIMARLDATLDDISADAQLAALLPGGLHSRTAGGEDFPFLTLSLVSQTDDNTYTGPWRHRFLYNVSVTDESESIDAASAALMRVYQLLNDAHKEDGAMPMEDFTLGFARRAGRTGISPSQTGVTVQRLTDSYRFEVYPK